MNYSFYGGRQGASFVIAARYDSISQMINCFKQGVNYSVVNYDEYVIIDTVNKNNKDNGKIYKRGYNHTDELGGAEYVGQIVGPNGAAPKLEMSTIANVNNLAQKEGFEYRKTSGSYNLNNQSLVPGKTANGTYNDSISWACCSVRDENNKDTVAYIGFTFPYTVIDYTAQSVSPYSNGFYTDTTATERTDDKTHPFYERWNIKIPKGIKGDTLKNFRLISASPQDNIQGYIGQDGDREGKQSFSSKSRDRKILVYDYYRYDNQEGGEPISLFLGDYNMVSDFSIEDDGTVKIAYTHDDDDIWENKFKWIDNISLTPEGQFTVNYNYGENSTKYQTSLGWINNVALENNGTIKFKYNNQLSDIVYNNKIKWIDNIVLNRDGDFNITYNTGEQKIFDSAAVWIKNFTIADNGTVRIEYNNTNGGTNGVDEWPNLIQWIASCTFDDSGLFRLSFNNGADDVVQHIKWIDDISINNTGIEGEQNQKIHIRYNNGEEKDIGSPINYIIKTIVRHDNFHLLVLYSDPQKRKALKDLGLTVSYQDRDDWYDLGSVKDENGILIGKNYPLSVFTNQTIEGIANKLNEFYPEGLNDTENMRGKIISVGDPEDTKMLFAFDYTSTQDGYNGWYYLGNPSQTSATKIKMCVMVGSDDSEKTISLSEKMPTGTVWFVVQGNSTPIDFEVEDETLTPELYEKLCVLVGRKNDIRTAILANTLITGSIWFITKE